MKVREIADVVGGEVFGNADADITGIAALETATANDIAFFTGQTLGSATTAACVLVSGNCEVERGQTVIRASDPKLAFAKASQLFRQNNSTKDWHETAHVPANSDVTARLIGPFVSLGEGTSIGEGAEIHAGSRVGDNVIIGRETIIHSNCVIYDGAVIGSNCVIHAGSVIGADGFGYVRDENGVHIKFPQVGTVVIEDHVEIGANSCIDRGSLGETRIGEGTKIDNLIQIAHNVQIGKRCIVASLTGISGSSILEDDVVLAGQVGIADHVTLKKGVVIGAKSAVFPNKIVHSGVWCGVPVQRIDDYKRQHAILKGVERLKDRLEEIERRLNLARADS